ncbi:helix-turn-helix transcriptional regulator [Dictyobacter kobayashii]|uniref:Transcriptional regulator n=1 Tax=Dictyobacter kobayashii TaxID=2014872 RepID=A0A402APU4_9CHLR|nr:YafY family protein [Dictyobacter kobayashii]GCE21112.1 transcriptional regulator [Dictyobacter kobayashii]
MNRVDRLTAIVMLLQGGQRTARELAQRFEVSRRTVFRDIESLCEMGVPIITTSGPLGGYSLMPDYTLSPLQLTASETFLLRLALSSVSQLADTPFKQERESLLAKLAALMPEQHSDEAEHLLRTIQLDIPTRHYATPFIEQLIASARTGQWLVVVYRSGQRTSQQTLRPIRLYSAGGFWYCQAYSHERQEERTYRVDRFISVSPATAPTATAPAAPATASLPYGHPSLPEVCIRLTAYGVMMMERDPHLGHAIQAMEDEEGLLRFRCPPSEYPWLLRTLLSLGPDAEVLAPTSLKSQLRQAALAIAQRYP